MKTLSEMQTMATQVSEIYAERFGIDRDPAWYLGKMTEELGELTSAYFAHSGQARKPGSKRDMEDEAADLLGFLLLFSQWQGIELQTAFQRKWGQYLEADYDTSSSTADRT